MGMGKYGALVSRDGKFWMITVRRDTAAVVGVTQARTLAEVEPMARDLVAAVLAADGTGAGAAPIDIAVIYPAAIQDEVRAAEAAAAAAKEAAKAAHARTRRAALQLRTQGLSTRDIAAALHCSPAWAALLIKDPAAGHTAAA